jgi:hypothetical protein
MDITISKRQQLVHKFTNDHAGKVQGGAMNRGLLFAGPLPLLFGGCER